MIIDRPTLVNCKARMVSYQYSFLCCNWSVLIENQEIGFTKVGTERVICPSSDSSLLHAWNHDLKVKGKYTKSYPDIFYTTVAL